MEDKKEIYDFVKRLLLNDKFKQEYINTGLISIQGGELVDSDGAPIAQRACTWENAPAAANNAGMIVPITNVSSKGYDLFISNGIRLYPIAGSIDLAMWRNRITVQAANSNETTNNAVSVLKVEIPYSTVNGSLLGNGDTISMKLEHARSASGTGSISRSFFIGTHPTLPLNNTLIERRTNTSSTNLYIVETPIFHKINSTSVQFIGRKNMDQWSGPSSTAIHNSVDDVVTGIPSMDANKVYLDVVLRHLSNVSEQLIFDFGHIQLLSTGPVTG